VPPSIALLVRAHGAPVLARRRHGVLAAASSPPHPASPRVAAQLSSANEDAGFESLDGATSSGEDWLVKEVSNSFFFAVARVPPPPGCEAMNPADTCNSAFLVLQNPPG
jgi:hypothetical protein